MRFGWQRSAGQVDGARQRVPEPYRCSLMFLEVGQSVIWMLSPFLDQIHYRAREKPVNCDFFLKRLGGTGADSPLSARAKSCLKPCAPSAPLAFELNYQWHTFYGVADSLGEVRNLALDPSGNIHCRLCEKTWVTPLHAYSGDYDVMIMKLNTDGEYQWHTFYQPGQPGANALDQNGV
jgi:hypothetical protein